jgi:hypothetical protein
VTALTHRVPPEILAARHAHTGRRRAAGALKAQLAATVTAAARPWSIGIDVLTVASLLTLMCGEVAGYGFTRDWQHLAAAVIAYTAATVYAFRAFTTERED